MVIHRSPIYSLAHKTLSLSHLETEPSFSCHLFNIHTWTTLFLYTMVSNCPRHRSYSTFTYIRIITLLTKLSLSVGLHIILHPDIHSLFVTTFSLILQLSVIFATTTCFLILRSSFICTITLLVSVISLLSNVLTCYLWQHGFLKVNLCYWLNFSHKI